MKKAILISLTPFLLSNLYSEDIKEYKEPIKEQNLEKRIQEMKQKDNKEEKIKELYLNVKDPEFRKQEMEKMKDPEFRNKELESKIEHLTKAINEFKQNNNSYENLEKLLTGENISKQGIEGINQEKEVKEEKEETILPEPIKIAKIGNKITLYVNYKILKDKENKIYEDRIIKINKGFKIEDWELTTIERDYIEYTNKKENTKIIKYFNKSIN